MKSPVVHHFPKTIPAFSLNETLVALLITTIVASMAFSVFSLVEKQMQSAQQGYQHRTEFLHLKESLWVDFHQSDGVWYNAKEATLLCHNEMAPVRYRFTAQGVIRDRDTLDVPIESLEFFFDNISVTTGEVDALRLITPTTHGQRQLFVYKTNAATSYIP